MFLVFFQLKNSNELFHCSNGAFIKKEHVCNGNNECLDGSDEADCQDGECYGTWNFNSPTNSSRKRKLHLDRLHLREMTPREKGETRFSSVGWFSRALAFHPLYYPWGKMGTTSSIALTCWPASMRVLKERLHCEQNSLHSHSFCMST